MSFERKSGSASGGWVQMLSQNVTSTDASSTCPFLQAAMVPRSSRRRKSSSSDTKQDRLRLIGYRAKWDEESYEYHHTPRRFDFERHDRSLLQSLKRTTLKCWRLFELTGYARVDYRVDRDGIPWILEINSNPCLSPDSGFTAATRQAGLRYEEVIGRIVEDAFRTD